MKAAEQLIWKQFLLKAWTEEARRAAMDARHAKERKQFDATMAGRRGTGVRITPEGKHEFHKLPKALHEDHYREIMEARHERERKALRTGVKEPSPRRAVFNWKAVLSAVARKQAMRKDWSDAAREAALRARQLRDKADDLIEQYPWTSSILSSVAQNYLLGWAGMRRGKYVREQAGKAWHPKMGHGWNANRQGKGAHDNPYMPGSPEAKHWAYGWKMAEQGKNHPMYRANFKQQQQQRPNTVVGM